jgi:hypothetical protein
MAARSAWQTTTMPSADTTKATQMLHAGSGMGVSVAIVNSSAARRSPRATPSASSRRTTSAAMRRAVPETRLRVASSVIAVVSVMPGSSAMSAEMVTIDG